MTVGYARILAMLARVLAAGMCVTLRRFKGNWGISKNKGTFRRNFVPNSGLRKFGHGMSTVAECDKQATVVDQLITLVDSSRG